MKIWIDYDEWYPVYMFTEEEQYKRMYDKEVEITDKELEWLNHAFSEFNKAQDFLQKKRNKKDD